MDIRHASSPTVMATALVHHASDGTLIRAQVAGAQATATVDYVDLTGEVVRLVHSATRVDHAAAAAAGRSMAALIAAAQMRRCA